MSYLVAAYAVLWAVSFVLVFAMVMRQRRLDSELQALCAIVEDEPRSDAGK
jgi:CcmD family protein